VCVGQYNLLLLYLGIVGGLCSIGYEPGGLPSRVWEGGAVVLCGDGMRRAAGEGLKVSRVKPSGLCSVGNYGYVSVCARGVWLGEPDYRMTIECADERARASERAGVLSL
jgi:hypothetical protein